ncbi:hypothetical protein DPMN_070753 [Dreissena polymorpha]|uniref:Uncharacterized protein n=1 Tax=Dreissena polymorpha TaxID=45954 RepID=A0A9D3Z5Q9_DREPO|nr:hypothetical protein DPMN_070753 [Dreissena polymorpha]
MFVFILCVTRLIQTFTSEREIGFGQLERTTSCFRLVREFCCIEDRCVSVRLYYLHIGPGSVGRCDWYCEFLGDVQLCPVCHIEHLKREISGLPNVKCAVWFNN